MTRKRKLGGDHSEIELPITPMLDMAFQLLTFFIFTYHPSALEGQMEMMLPATGEAKAKDKKDVDPSAISDQDPIEESQVTIGLKTQQGDNSGALSQWTISGLTNASGNRLPELKVALEKLRKDSALTKKESIKIQADSALKWMFVVQVMDVCKATEFSNIGFAPPPDMAAAPAGGAMDR